jgi:hypothetical protein
MLEEIMENFEQFIRFLQQLVKNAGRSMLLWLWQNLKSDPTGLMGPGYKTPNLIKDVDKVALVVSSASLIDLLSNQSLMQLFAAGLPPLMQFLVGFLMNLFLLVITNTCASIATKQVSQSRKLARVAVIGFIGLSIIRSGCAPLGVELFLNGPNIAELYATEIIEQQAQKIEDLRQDPEYKNLQQEVEQKDQRLSNRQDPNWDSRYVELYGRFGTNYSCKLPKEQQPLKTRLKCLGDEIETKYRQQKQDFVDKRIASGKDLLFLEKHMPEIFVLKFTSQKEVRSVHDSARIAMQNLSSRVQRLDFTGLSLPLIAFLLSAVTSYAACMASIRLGQSYDAQLSYEEELMD